MLYKFTDNDREIGCVDVNDVGGILLEGNYLILIIQGIEMQVIFSTEKAAIENYAAISVRMERQDKMQEFFNNMFLVTGDLQ